MPSSFHNPPLPVQYRRRMGEAGGRGHDAAGRHVGGIKQERLAGAQQSIAIITAGQKCLRLRQIVFFLVVPVIPSPYNNRYK